MKKLSMFLLFALIVAMVPLAATAKQPPLSAAGEAVRSPNRLPAPETPGTLWANGSYDDINGLSSELNTVISDARTADDFMLEAQCPLYDVTQIRGTQMNSSNPWNAQVEVYADSGGIGPGALIGTYPMTSAALLGYSQFGWEMVEYTYNTPGLQLPPGHYWVSSIGLGDGSYADRSFFATSGNGAVQLQEGYFLSNYFGYPSWTPGTSVYGYYTDYAFDVDGVCSGQQPPDIQVTPESLSAEQCPDEVTAQTLQICNVGGGELVWNLAELQPGKAVASPTRGADRSRTVELKLDAAGGGSVATHPPTVDAPVSLVLDDGSRENDIGIGGTLEMIWLNRFTPSPADFPFDLTQVQVYFSTIGLVNVGDQMRLVIYENTSGNNDPAVGSNLLATFDVTVGAVDAWNVYDLPAAVTFNGPGDALIGVIGLEVPGTSYWPASIDQTVSLQRSWAGWWDSSPPPVPPVLPPPNWTLIDAYFPGNWMVRGYGETGGAPDIPWLSEDPTGGTLQEGQCVDVTVTFDSTGLAVGDYFGGLVIDSNDPDEPQVYVPVQMSVIPCGGCTWVDLLADDFESGTGNWTMDGLWNPENEADACGSLVAPFPSSSNDAYYGIDGQCTFNNGSANSGSLTLAFDLDLGAAQAADMNFWSWEQTECYGNCYYDNRTVEASTDGGATWGSFAELGTEGAWYNPAFDLSAYVGGPLRLRFRFDTIDSGVNDYFGWMVDNVTVRACVAGQQEPDIEVTPESLYAEQCPDTQTTQTLQICNEGTADLTWSLTEQAAPKAAALVPDGKPVVPQGASTDRAVQPYKPRIEANTVLYITTTDTGASVEQALNELGVGYDYYYDGSGDWTGINFAPYDVVIVGMDGGTVSQASIQKVRTDVVDQGKRLIFLGGTCWQDFAIGVNNYLVGNDINNYCWQITNPTQWTVVNPGHPLAAGLPGSYNYVNPSAGYYQTRASDPALTTVAINGEAWPTFFYKDSFTEAGGDMIWYLDSVYGSYWTDPSDFALLKQLIANSLGYNPQPGIPWLSENPTSGTVQAGTCQDVTVTFDSTGMAPGDYFANLVITSNDPDEPTVTVPVQLTVLDCANNTMHVGFIHLRAVDRGYGKFAERAQVQILDFYGGFVPDATVYVEWTLPDGQVVPQNNITRPIGEAAFKVKGFQQGVFQLCVTDVVKAGWVYDPNQNVETCDWLTVP